MTDFSLGNCPVSDILNHHYDYAMMLIDCGKEFETNLDTTHSIFPEKISKKIEEKERCKRQRAVLEADEPNNNNAGIGIQIEV